ncbi:hypothetical protein BD626DRAFT_421369 [Schizophyllum amplum]|uniref:DH domain-containing protein n=1 Tax=Schizophyllum amplum TaxID=97359 RepID=A0A550CWV5_9AGAR|nr:hypothetical protein BD626DRAFT_421369 [Auriculariopsis ampla]
MASAGRKKSIISQTGVIDSPSPVVNNLNKAASQSTSLYQQSSSLKSRLLRIRGFSDYFGLITSTDSRQSSDPVTQLWDLFSFGIPLCYLFDQLPDSFGLPKINSSSFNPDAYETNPDRAKKHAIMLFSMQIRTPQFAASVPGAEPFTVTELWTRESTDGLVKVVNTVTAMVNMLPSELFEEDPPTPPMLPSQGSTDSLASDAMLAPPPSAGSAGAKANVLRELVETERKYVGDLEVMHKYSQALFQRNLLTQDLILLLFPNLNKLINFQRQFLIQMEATFEQPWHDQRWGQLFLDNEEGFIVYEPYCANYIAATDIVGRFESTLKNLNDIMNSQTELPAFLIKPVQRVCKYPLLLESLLKYTSREDYPHYDELCAAVDSAKRIAATINETQRASENEQTVKNLSQRVEDWKGHHLENFGRLLLDDVFTVTKSDIDREYHVFLFQKIILCCKEVHPQGQNGTKKVSKSNSLLKKQGPPIMQSGSSASKRTTPLLLKGRIFLSNVTQAVPVPARSSVSGSASGMNSVTYPLAVWWKGDDDLEFFTLRCRHEDQRSQWQTEINRLITEAAQRRASERGLNKAVNGAMSVHPHMRQQYQSYNGRGTPGSPQLDGGGRSRGGSVSRMDTSPQLGGHTSTYSMSGAGPQGYPPHDGFEFEPDEDEFEDYPTTSYGPGGRDTPQGQRRNNAMSLPHPERDHSSHDRPRANTEDVSGAVMTQWRSNIPPTPGALRPITPRLSSANSQASYSSDASFGNDTRRPSLRSQFSSSKLRTTYEDDAHANGLKIATNNTTPTPANRSRSASQPNAYIPKTAPPPMPSMTQWKSSVSMAGSSKRGSGSSQSSTADSSDYSPNSSSPVTTYGSSESSLGVVRPSRSQHFEQTPHSVYGQPAAPYAPPVKVKVHFHEDIFVIQVPRSTEYAELVEKVGRKIRLCGPRRDDGPLRVKYRDEDGDMVSLGSTEDVQMAFEQYKPGTPVTLFVQ